MRALSNALFVVVHTSAAIRHIRTYNREIAFGFACTVDVVRCTPRGARASCAGPARRAAPAAFYSPIRFFSALACVCLDASSSPAAPIQIMTYMPPTHKRKTIRRQHITYEHRLTARGNTKGGDRSEIT